MPLPWKKNKVARISRFVNDLHSPKRGGSLVVQTGFPTSLVDLFVKNRDRLKKHSKKTKSKKTQTQIEFVLEDGTPPPPPPPPPSPPPTDSCNLIVNSSSSPSRPGNEIIASHVQKFVVAENFGGRSVGVGVDGSTRNGVLVAVLKMFVMVVLALSTKTLAVGVTMSAIVLLLLEYVGVGARPLLCFKARTFLISFFRLKKNGICEGSRQNSGCELVNDIGPGTSSEEILQVEEVGIGDQRTRCLNSDTIYRILEEEVKSNKNNDRSCRGAKIREKLVKRLVPKKLRGSKKGKEAVGESRRSQGQDKLCRLLEQEQDNENESSMVLLEEEESGRGGSVFHQETESQGKERVEREREGNSSGYLILFLIALAGLVGGRIVAIVLALGWCLMLKLVGKSRPVSC